MFTEAEKQRRREHITGTDAAVICNVSPWGNLIDLWRIKTGVIDEPDLSDSRFIKAGVYLEPVVKQWYQDETNDVIEQENTWVNHKTNKWMGGNVDGIISSKRAVFEAKTTYNDAGWGEQGENVIPDYYLCQVAHYVACADLERAVIAVLIRGSDLRYYTYERNEKLEKVIIEREKEFYHCVVNGVAPTPRNSQEIVSLYGDNLSNEIIVADCDVLEELEKLKELKARLKEYEASKTQMEEKIKCFMQDKQTLVNPHSKTVATWRKTSGYKKFNDKQFKAEHPDLYEQYLNIEAGGHRTLLVK